MKKIVMIVGPTASGKTDLALKLAKKFNGEIIAADSRTLYKAMDIGTAKPTVQERRDVTHHLVDALAIGEKFSVADFKQKAEASIAEITARNKLPIVVGGSGLYVDSLLYEYSFGESEGKRSSQNPRHLAVSNRGDHSSTRARTLVIGIDVDKDILEKRIEHRIEAMIKAGLVEEARALSQNHGWELESMKTYTPLQGYIEGEETLEEAKTKLFIKDRQLAKKQRTWFKRNKSIQWVNDPKQAVVLVTTFLNK